MSNHTVVLSRYLLNNVKNLSNTNAIKSHRFGWKLVAQNLDKTLVNRFIMFQQSKHLVGPIKCINVI